MSDSGAAATSLYRLFIIVAALLPVEAIARDHDRRRDTESPRLSIDSIFEQQAFHAKDYDATWLADEDAFWRLEAAVGSVGKDLVRIDAASGDREVVVPANDLIPAGEEQPLEIESFQWSAGGDKLLIFTDSKRVWRYKTRGRYWVYDRTTRVLHRLGGDAATPSLMFAKFSPDGNSVAYVRDREIWLESLLDHSVRSLTPDSSASIINGTFDWVYEEELSARDGFRWSPDGRRIAFWQLDTSGVPKFTLINNTDRFYPSVMQYAYPKTGQRNSDCRIAVVDVRNGTIQTLSIPGDPRQNYLARMEWDGPNAVIVQQLNRLQNRNRLLRVGLISGNAHTVLIEEDEAWVDVHDELKWISDRSEFTWISERDGWRHVYRVSTDGDSIKRVTQGDADVMELLYVDEQNGDVYYLASPGEPTCNGLYRSRLDGSPPERVTPAKQKGIHRYRISPSGKFAIHEWSAFGRAPRIELVELPRHKRVRLLETNRELRRKLKRLELGKHRFFRVKIGDGVELDGWCILPPDFDNTKKYPVLIQVYGEPAGQTVVDRWGGNTYLWHQMLAQRGYVIISVDNRGTPAPRGRAWRKVVHRQVGILAPDEQARAIRGLLKRRSYLDADRIGVWGWSGGGSMSLHAIFKYPDLYRTAIAIAPVPNQRHYDSIYQERYMGLPSDNVDGYLQGSPIHFAKHLKGNLLLIHGTGDDNCHYQTTESLINELVRHEKQFEMMAYPNRTHGLREGIGTTVHMWTLITDYLRQHLPPGPR